MRQARKKPARSGRPKPASGRRPQQRSLETREALVAEHVALLERLFFPARLPA